MSENDKSNIYDDNLPSYELDESAPEIYLTNREVIYEPRCCLFIVTLPILPFWLLWLAGKWLIERLQK
jgi:hypothetical protein